MLAKKQELCKFSYLKITTKKINSINNLILMSRIKKIKL